MARDRIGNMGVELQDMGKEIPVSGSVECKPKRFETITRVGVDFEQYRWLRDREKERKNQ